MSKSGDNSTLCQEIIDNQEPIHPFVEPDKSRYENLFKNLQGGVIKNYEQSYSLHLLIYFRQDKINEAKHWIRDKIANRITSTYAQLQQKKVYEQYEQYQPYEQEIREKIAGEKLEAKTPNTNSSSEKIYPSAELCVNFFLSCHGYNVLGFNDVEQRLTDAHFKQGMKKWYQSNIGSMLPQGWDIAADDDIQTDALILLAHDDLTQLEAAAAGIVDEISDRKIGGVVACDAGYVLRNETNYSLNGDLKKHKFKKHEKKHEYVVGPFGFADNLSQPLFLQKDVEKYYQQHHVTKQDELTWDPFAPLSLVLLEDPFVKGEYGSYCVWQKLQTDYQCFANKEEELANKLGVDRERAGALIIGRFRDGTPLELSSLPQGGEQNENNFDYKTDPHGLRCPLHAHIRKVNPRGERDPENPNSPPPPSSQKRSRIFRAGVTYFNDQNIQTGSNEGSDESSNKGSNKKISQSYVSKLEHLREVSKRTLPENIKKIGGLLFICFQSSITRQFSTLQISWANDPSFPRQQRDKKKSIDPVIGDSPERQIFDQEWPKNWNEEEKEEFLFQGCVQNKGGEFFFAPSIGFLRNITDLGVTP